MRTALQNRATFVVVALLIASCAPEPRGMCRAASDCGNGTSCDVALGYCVEAGCALDCGDGFDCIRRGGSETCENDPDRPGYTRILSILPEHASAVAPVVLTCEARGPQVVDVRFHLISPEGDDITLPGVLSAESQFTATWKVPLDASEGRWMARCDLVFGPPGAQLVTSSTPHPLVVDRTAPRLQHASPSRWFSTAETATLHALASDPEPSDGMASGISRVWIEAGDLDAAEGMETEDGGWEFSLPLSALAPDSERRSLAYVLHAVDRAGNRSRTDGSLRVDDSAPVITIADGAHSAWRSLNDGDIELLATISTAPDGAPLAPDSVELIVEGVSEPLAGELIEVDEALWRFTFDPTIGSSALAESERTWTVRAATSAGVVSYESGAFRLDTKGPAFAVESPGWLELGAVAAFEGTVSDAGCGLNHETFSAEATLGELACDYSDGAFSCELTTHDAPAGEESRIEATLTAQDECGNSSIRVVDVKVDDRGPQFAVPDDDGWHALQSSLAIRVRITDGGAGLSATPPKIEALADPGVASISVPGTFGGGPEWIFVLDLWKFLEHRRTYPELRLRLTAVDGVGNVTTEDFTRAIDGEGPRFVLDEVEGEPIRRNAAPVRLSLTVTDDGVGLDSARVRLEYSEWDGFRHEVPATAEGDRFVVDLDPSLPFFESAEGPLTFDLVGADLLGNENTQALSIQVTRKLWEYDTYASASVISSPALGDGLMVFAVSANGLNSITDNLFAIDATTGSKLWSARVPGTPTTPVALGDDVAYLAFVDGSGKGHVAAYALNPMTDPVEPLWVCEDIGTVDGALALAKWMWGGELRETVVAATSARRTRAMSLANGGCDFRVSGSLGFEPAGTTALADEVAWSVSPNGAIARSAYLAQLSALDVESVRIGGDGASLAGTALDGAHRAFAIHPGILRRWTSAGSDYESTASDDLFTSPAPPSIDAEGRVWFGTTQGSLYRFDPPSTLPAQRFPIAPISSDPIRGAPTIDSEGNAYVVTRSGLVRAHSAAGALRWIYDTGSGNVTLSSPVLGCDGTLYVGTSNGKIVALVADGGPLADAPWPRFQHDNRNTGNADTPLRTGGDCID